MARTTRHVAAGDIAPLDEGRLDGQPPHDPGLWRDDRDPLVEIGSATPGPYSLVANAGTALSAALLAIAGFVRLRRRPGERQG